MKWNKLLLYFLTAALCSPVLIGCSSGTEYNHAEVPEINFGYWDIDSLQNASKSDALTTELENMFHFKATFHSFDWNTYKEQYQILAATGELPDVFMNVLLSSSDVNDTAIYDQMIQEGMIRPFPDDLSDYPHLQELLEDYDYLRYSDGHIYALPHSAFKEDILSSSDAAMLVRKDWMETLGIDAPQNFEEFVEMTAAFASDDPDGNGKNDTIGYNVNNVAALGKWVMLGIAPECNVYSWIEDTDGMYRPCWMTDSFRDVITAYRKLYTSGGLDPNFYIKNSSTVVNDFLTGKLGALEYKSSASVLSELKEMWNEKNSLPFEDCVDVLPIFPAPDGVRYSNSSNSFWSETYISSSVTDEELDIILSLMDYLLSDEGIELYTRGIPDADYKKNKDGTLVSCLSNENSSHFIKLTEKYPSVKVWSNLAQHGCDMSDFEDTPENRFLYGKDCVSLAENALNFCKENTVQIDRPYDFLVFPKEPSNTSSDAFDAFIRCIIGTDDPLLMWDEALSKLKAGGLDDYVLRQNQSYQNRTSSTVSDDK